MDPLPFPNNPLAYTSTPWLDPAGGAWLYEPAKNRWSRAEHGSNLTAHASTHATDGSDPISPDMIGAASEEFAIAMAVAL